LIKEITIRVLFIGIGLTGLATIYVNSHHAYAHSFAPNDLSKFLSLVYEAEVELSLANDNFPFNVTLALDHAEYATKLIDDAYYFDEDIIDDTDFIERYDEALDIHNSTIRGLVIANMVDQVLKAYGEAYDIGYDLANMSNMIEASDINSSFTLSDSNDPNTKNSTNQNNTLHVTNIADYQSAQKLSEKAYQILRTDILTLFPSSNNITASVVTRLEKGMADLNRLTDNKAPARELMMVVHGQVHPNLQLAYNLELKQ
jgi:hypothetical protein